MSWMSEKETLEKGIRGMGLDVDQKKIDLLMDYLALFEKWNRTYNLSSIRDPKAMVTLHLLDSLSIMPYIKRGRFIDVGTGGGLPGIPLSIIFPDSHFTLLDSAGKKTRFLFQVSQALNLHNVDVQNCRVESFKPELLFDGVISRAFASLKDMTDNCEHLISKDGTFFAMKGVMPVKEIKAIEECYSVVNCHILHVPNLDAERCLIELKPK